MPNNDNYIGAAMGLDVTDLKAGIKEANKQIQLANSEFKAASSGMDDWTKSSEGLSAKIKQLDSVLKMQESKLAGLRAEYDRVVKSQGENSEAARNLQIQINNQQSIVNKTSAELKNYRTTLEGVEAGTIDLEDVTIRGGKAIEKAGKQAKEAGDDAADSGDGFTVMKGAISDLVSEGIQWAIDKFKEFAFESEAALSKFQGQTGASAAEMKQFKKQMEEIYAENWGESMEDIADAMAKVKQSTKETDPEALKQLTIDAISLRDTFGYDFTETMRAVNMLMDQFGITGEEAFNLIVQGAQNGLDKNGDLLDTINEYSVHYKQLGYDSDEFFNSLLNGAKEGTFSVDKLGDAMKEFGIRVKDNSKSTTEAFEALGYGAGASGEEIADLKKKISKYEKELKYATIQQEGFTDKTSELTKLKTAEKIEEYTKNLTGLKSELKRVEEATGDSAGSVDELSERFAEGGDSAREATQEILEKLMDMDDEVKKNEIGVALFGTMWEDLGEDAIAALMDTNGEIKKTETAMKNLNKVTTSNVKSEFKAIGRTIVSEIFIPISQKVLPKIKEFVNVLTNPTAINNFSKALEWLSENGATLATVIGTAVIAFKSFQAVMAVSTSINAVTTAVAGLNTGVGIVTKTQTIWNAAMSANPLGAVLTAVGLLTAGIVILTQTMGENESAAEKRNEKAKETLSTVKEEKKAYDDLKTAQQEQAAADMAQIANVERLNSELSTLVDENGYVTEANKTRAQYILGELNTALGTEYEMTGNQIQGYKDMQAEIYKTIEARKAEILLNAQLPVYEEAIQSYMDKQMEQAKLTQKLAEQEGILDQKRKEAKEAQEAFDNELNQNEKIRLGSQLTQKKLAVEEEEKTLKELQKAYNTQEEHLRGYYSDINAYETASALLLEGKTAEAIAILDEKNAAFKTAASVAHESAEEQKKILEQQVIDTKLNAELMKERYKEGVEGVTEEMVKTAEEQAEKAQTEFEKVGGNITSGIAKGMENEEKLFQKVTKAASGLVGQALEAAREAAGIESPSKLFRDEVGVYLGQGIGVGILDSMPYVKKDINKFNGYLSENLGNVKSNIRAGSLSFGGSGSGVASSGSNGGVSIDARMTVNYNGQLSRRELKRMENDNYTAIKNKLKAEGAL